LVNVLNKIEVDTEQLEVVVAPTAIHIPITQSLIQKNISVAAQNVSLTGPGAYTGELAAEQLIGMFLLYFFMIFL
jgi:triosephosphate isomerase